MMTATHKEKLQRGREAALEAKLAREDRQLIAWRDWLREDARLFAALRRGDEGAREAWLENLRHEPARPPDSAFRRARGDSADDA